MKKNVLILSHSDSRGDGSAAYDLARCLIKERYNVVLLVIYKTRNDPFIIQPTIIKKKEFRSNLFFRACRKVSSILVKKDKPLIPIRTDSKYDFSINQEIEELVSEESILASLSSVPNLIITGSVHQLVNTSTLASLKRRTGAEVYMLTMDMAPLTGGCQHAWSCRGYQLDCRNCPAIIDEVNNDIAHKNLMVKLNNIKKADIKVLTASGRLHEQAKTSLLFKDQKIIYNINSFIDTEIFNNKHRDYAKKIFGLPVNSKIIFAGAEHTNNERKGISYFIESLYFLEKIIDDQLRTNIMIFISGRKEKNSELINAIPFKSTVIDYITDERLLSIAYQAADIFVCSSVEDPGPRMVSQALACGTPVVGFEMGILYNMVYNGYNGFKAELRNSRMLAEGMKSILTLDCKQFNIFSNNAIRQVKKFSSTKTINDIFEKILE